MARRLTPKPKAKAKAKAKAATTGPRSLRDVAAIAATAVAWVCDCEDVIGLAVFMSNANATNRPALLVRFYRRGESLSRWFEPDVSPGFVRRVLAEACRSADLNRDDNPQGEEGGG